MLLKARVENAALGNRRAIWSGATPFGTTASNSANRGGGAVVRDPDRTESRHRALDLEKHGVRAGVYTYAKFVEHGRMEVRNTRAAAVEK